jgi:N-acetylglucosamine-6-phosphate deacetylase
MTILSFRNGRVVTATGVREDATLRLDGPRIAGIDTFTGEGEIIDLDGGWIVPGFIDVQVNGGGGVLFNDAIHVDGIRAIADAHRPFGTTGLLPTLISDSLEHVAQALDACEAAIEAGVPGILGVHIEGPFLNERRNGIHDTAFFRRIDQAAIALLTRPRRGKVLLTLAPELCAPQDIASLVQGGVIVSAGHSDADYDTVMAAIAAGLSGFTHLFNAMSPLHHRKPGMVGAAFDAPATYTGLIADGAHVHPAAMRLVLRARDKDRIVLVTDAMPSVGALDKSFTLQGKAIHVANGICLDDAGTLAGSDLDMAGAVRNIVQMAGADVADASVMASLAPAGFLGLSDRGAIAPGQNADLVWLDANLFARATWQNGRLTAG